MLVLQTCILGTLPYLEDGFVFLDAPFTESFLKFKLGICWIKGYLFARVTPSVSLFFVLNTALWVQVANSNSASLSQGQTNNMIFIDTKFIRISVSLYYLFFFRTTALVFYYTCVMHMIITATLANHILLPLSLYPNYYIGAYISGSWYCNM